MLKDIKFYFENLFATKWKGTSIHFGGQEFDPKALGIKKWVNPYYSPLRNKNFGLGDGAKIYFGDLYITCWEDNDVLVMELADEVSSFIEEEVDKTLFRFNGYEVVDHGWDSTNKAFILLSFSTQTIRGKCFPSAQPTTATRIVHNGVQLVHKNVILTK